MLIGLTGKYCAGKNHIAAILEKKGFPVLDIDKLGHQVLEIEKKAICGQFGADLLKTDGSLDRRLLGQRVYGQQDKLPLLEAIVHPKVNQLTDEWIQNREELGDRAIILNAALLHKSSVFDKLGMIILVSAPYLTRLLRAKKRDKLSFREIIKRFASQKDFNDRYLSINSRPDSAEIYRVENSGFLKLCLKGCRYQKLELKIDKIMERIG